MHKIAVVSLLRRLVTPVVKTVAKAFGSASDDLTRASAKWWAKAGKEVAEETGEQATRLVDKLISGFKQVSELGEKAGAEVNNLVREGHKDLGKAIQRLRSEVVEDQREIQRLTRTIYPTKKVSPEELDEVAQEQAEQMLIELQGRVRENKGIMESLSSAWKRASDGQVEDAINILEGTEVPLTHPGVAAARNKYNEALNLTRNIMNQATTGSDAAFLKKYLALKRSPAAKRKLELWLANPRNNARLNKLMERDKIADILEAGRLTRRQKLLGVSIGDTAKRLGVGTAALAGGAGLLKVYDWFSDNPPDKNVKVATGLGFQISRLQVRGPGAAILNDVKNSLSTISNAAKNVETKLSTEDAKDATQEYITTVSNEVNDINTNLSKWQMVVDNSNNPREAQRIGQKLTKYVENLTGTLVSLSKKLGVSIDISKTPDMVAQVGENEVSKIQDLLGIRQTGKVDRNTINVLRRLEQEFNDRSGTNEWTNALVSPNGDITDYNNLIRAFNVINQY